MKNLLLFMSILLWFHTTEAQVIFTKPQSNRIANYNIKASLDTQNKLVKASMTMVWKNTTNDTVSDLQFHAYMNAFKNTASTFMTESGGQLRGDYMDVSDETAWGWLKIQSIKTASGDEIVSQMSYIQPDDKNTFDQTVFQIPLKKGIAPNESIELNFKFETKLPKIFARTGYVDDFYMVAQWFPKIGVYEQDKGWNCHQFHAHSEFFADFGIYDVELTFPKDYIIGATGGLQSEKILDDSLKVQTWRAEDVIDFAWTASQKFIEKSYIRNELNVRILLQPEHLKYDKRHSEALDFALEYFEKHVGAYPYKHITVVDPPVAASGAGGMEYPTLITAGTFGFLPEGIRTTEIVVVHEFGHQYFMGLLASNEFEEAWLDEGLNTYMETRIMDNYYKKDGFANIAGFDIQDIEYQRIGYARSSHISSAETFRKSWEYPAGGYGAMNYNKPATFLTTYERIVGQDVMDEILKTYFERFKFKHPKTTDFLSVVKEITKKHHGSKIDVEAFFQQVLFGAQVCDYQVSSIKSSKLGGNIGWFDTEHTSEYKISYGEDAYRSTVTIVRNGDMVLPTDLKITYANGDTETVAWNGAEKYKTFIFDHKYKVIRAELDPETKNLMDTNLNNNSFTTQKETTGLWKVVFKIMFFLQNLIQSIAFLA